MKENSILAPQSPRYAAGSPVTAIPQRPVGGGWRWAAWALAGMFCLLSLPRLSMANDGLDEDFQKRVERLQFNGGVLVARNDEVVFKRAYGFADFATRRRNTPALEFPIASISKLLTATAILQLVQAGKARPDDAVAKYLPSFPYPQITLRHLLSHTSGLPPYNAYFGPLWKESPGRVFTNADFLPVVSRNPVPLLYEPGDRGNYDNVNYIVLALLLEKISGQSYPAYIEKHVLKPAGMRHTRFLPLPVQYNSLRSTKFAYPHVYPHSYSREPLRASTIPYIRDYWHAYAFSGFADYVSTMEDLLRLDAAYRHQVVLDLATQGLAFTPVVPRLEPDKESVFGLGWEVDRTHPAGQVVFHSGAATGLSCVLMRDLRRDWTVIVFDNTHSNAREVADRALRIVNAEPVAPLRRSAAALYVNALLRDGPEVARGLLDSLRQRQDEFVLSEDEMNTMGYELLGSENPFRLPDDSNLEAAIQVLQMNTILFPESWNAWDSYGEALRKAGHVSESISAYRRSLSLKADNQGAIQAIRAMQ